MCSVRGVKAADSLHCSISDRYTRRSYFTFLPEIEIVGFPAREFAVAETFVFSCFGFLVSFLLFLPLAIVCPYNVQRSGAEVAWVRLRSVTDHLFQASGVVWSDLAYFGGSYSNTCPKRLSAANPQLEASIPKM